MQISVIFEGGIGDFVCAARFVPSIKKRYPDAIYNLYSNTDKNPTQANFINQLWPNYFDAVYQVTRANKDHYKTSQFGREKYNAAYDNIIESDRKLIELADKVYNLHIDGLQWLDYPECQEAYHVFPKSNVRTELKFETPDKFVLAHLFARPDSDRKLEDFYVKRLVSELSKENFVIIPVEEKYLSYYDFCKDNSNIKVVATDLFETWELAQRCSAFIGVDSAIRYFSLCRPEVPNFVFNKYVSQPFQVPPYQQVRWVQNPRSALPMNFDARLTTMLVNECVKNFASYLFPEGAFVSQHIDNVIVRRNFVD